MTEENIHISSIKKRHSDTTGKDFHTAETNLGPMNIFDYVVVEEMEKAGFPNDFKVNMTEKGKWKNIIGIIMEEDGQSPAKVTEPIPTADNVISYDEKTFASMAISYAKDLAVAGKIEVAKIKKEAMGFLDLYRDMVGISDGE